MTQTQIEHVHIKGRVIDQRGRPVPTRQLRIEAWDWNEGHALPLGDTIPDAEGRFQITIAVDTYHYPTEHREWPDLFFRVCNNEGNVLTQTEPYFHQTPEYIEKTYYEICVSLSSVSGTLVYDREGDPNDIPLPGVDVHIESVDTHETMCVKTYDEGRFQAYVEPGEWLIKPDIEVVHAGSHLRLANEHDCAIFVQVQLEEHIDIQTIAYRLQGGLVQGIVFLTDDASIPPVSPSNEARLERVRVSLINQADNTHIDTQTDAQGVYSFSDLEPDRYTLHAQPRIDTDDLGIEKRSLQLLTDLNYTIFVGQGQHVQRNIVYVAVGGDIRGVVFLDANGSGKRFGDEPGVEDITVLLMDVDHQQSYTTTTGGSGGYLFSNIPPGEYTLRFVTTVPLENGNGKFGEELVITTSGKQSITVRTGKTVHAAPVGYRPEPHEIVGRVVYENGEPVPGVVVILQDEDGEVEVDRTVTDLNGRYIFRNRQGAFRIKFPDSPSEHQLITPAERDIEVNSVAQVPDTIFRLAHGRIGTIDGGRFDGSVQESISDIASYMPTSFETGGSQLRTFGHGTSDASAPLQQIVDNALTDVLGHRIRTNDHKAFLASLTRSFTPEEGQGRTSFKWTPRTYAVQTELGGELTGAQASLYHRTKVTVDDILPLLDGLTPLAASPDEQEVEAARSIVRTELLELVNELGIESGPRVQRVDNIFELLRIQLDRFRDVFGLTPENVITVEEERKLTDFLVIRDYVDGLNETWSGADGFRNQFIGNTNKFLGTQLVLLSRALSSVVESVAETEHTMDAVLLGLSERRTVQLVFKASVRIDNREEFILVNRETPPPMFIDELLSWVRRFAAEEGPVLIQDGGRRGVEAILPTAEQLQRLVLGAAQAEVAHVGFTRSRVRRSLSELAVQLEQVARLARELLLK